MAEQVAPIIELAAVGKRYGVKPVLDEFPDVDFLFHCPRGDISIQGLEPAYSNRIRVIPKALTKKEFFRVIASCSVVLVPYDPVAYRNRTSHIAIEALGAGRPIIVTDGSATADEIRRVDDTATVIASSFDPSALQTAIRTFLFDRETYLTAARCSAQKWRTAHSIDDFLTRVLLGKPEM